MKIIGKGFHGVVLKKSATIVRKYHTSEEQWRDEIDNLTRLASISSLDIGCTIPKLYGSGSATKLIDDRTYSYWTEMELIPGKTAHELVINTDEGDVGLIGAGIGTVLFNMHHMPKKVVDGYDGLVKTDPEHLLRHVLHDKMAKIIDLDTDSKRLSMVKEAANYLLSNSQIIIEESVLSHQDLNMQNIIINNKHMVEGLVDWSRFGRVHASLVLYQLAREEVWPYIEARYEELGGVLRKDIMYAATTIHLAWSRAYWLEKGDHVASNRSEAKLDKCYSMFKAYEHRR